MDGHAKGSGARRTDARRGLVWAVGAAVVSAVAVMAIMLVALTVGMSLVALGGLGERAGSAAYAGALIAAVLVYWAAIHFTVTLAGRHARVPWTIWPAMLVLPLGWVVATALNTSNVFEFMPALIAVAGTTGAFLTLGRRRFSVPGSTPPAGSGYSEPGSVPASMASSNEPVR